MKLAYMKCTKKQQNEFDDAATPSVEVAKCCSLLKSGQTEAMRHAIYNGHFECFKHGHVNGLEMPFFSCNLAAMKGSVEIMKYSHLSGSHLDCENVCQDSARGGSFECLVYGHMNGGRMTNETLLHSIRLGCAKSVSYAIENGAKWEDGCCAQTAYSGNLDFVKFCREIGCPWLVKNMWDWFQPASRLSFLHFKVKDETVLQEMRQIMHCVDYIMSTAEVFNGCGFRDNPAAQMVSDFIF